MADRRTTRGGFSLVELLAVVTILALLAALILPRVSVDNDIAKKKSCNHNRTEINVTVEQYYLSNGAWPANDLSDVATDANYFPNGLPTCPFSGAAYRLDPTTHRVIGHNGDSDHNP